MTHWQATPGTEYFVPIQKTMDVLNDLKAQGKIKAIGAAKRRHQPYPGIHQISVILISSSANILS